MFGNFIYFIIAFLIYATYPLTGSPSLSGMGALALFVGFALAFILATRFQFSRLLRQAEAHPVDTKMHQLDGLVARQSIVAVALFAVDIYVLDLPSYLSAISLFALIPSVLALVFAALFVAYFAIIWRYAYDAQEQLWPTDLGRRSYILSNLSFSIPILIPWLSLLMVADIIRLLPFAGIRRILLSPGAEALLILFYLIAVAVVGPAMVQKIWRCRPVEEGIYRNRIASVCNRAGVGYAQILYWPIFGGKMITAAVMGLVTRFRYILVTSGLLEHLSPDEVDAVIAHEAGHVKKHHMLFYLFFFFGFMLIAYTASDLALYAILYSELAYRPINAIGHGQEIGPAALASLTIVAVFLTYFRFLFGYFMRSFERQADIYVYQLFGSAVPLVSTLEKIAIASGQSPDKPNWHHYSISQRIDYLRKCESNRKWVQAHNRKVSKSIAIYAVSLLAVGLLGYSINFGSAGRNLSLQTLLRAVEQTPQNPDLHSKLGDLYYGRKDYENTIAAYTESLRLNPDNPHALNNLAWLYATCEEPGFRFPERAVALAEMAAYLLPVPHTLDTLAESYYAVGNMEKAVLVAQKALDSAKKNRPYYSEQLRKFQSARAENQMERLQI